MQDKVNYLRTKEIVIKDTQTLFNVLYKLAVCIIFISLLLSPKGENMRRLININTFKKIFSISKYRRKLDKIILDFYGLSLKKVTQKKTCENDDEVTILIIVMINTEVILKIIVKDVYNVLNQSKTFYINFSFREVCKSHELIIPCYWEIYIPYCFENLKEN